MFSSQNRFKFSVIFYVFGIWKNNNIKVYFLLPNQYVMSLKLSWNTWIRFLTEKFTFLIPETT